MGHRVKFRNWLEEQVERLQEEIARHRVFLGEHVATRDDLVELRRLLTIYRFLEQQQFPLDPTTIERELEAAV
jgi:hypothetical protein